VGFGYEERAAKGDDAIFMALHGPEWYGQGPACIEADKRRLWIGAWTLGLGGPYLSAYLCISLHLSAGLCISPRLSASLCISPRLYASLCASLRLSAYLCMALHVSIWLCMSLYGSACLCRLHGSYRPVWRRCIEATFVAGSTAR
jgi:hypothetical protein